MTTIRFFAAARAAVGVSSVEVSSAGASAAGASAAGASLAGASPAGAAAATLGDALAAVQASDPARWESLQERCSYLVDGITTKDRTTSLAGVELVDVMPPFAGG
ncbi:hypothetical protein [Curtobacterium sp. RRHDQ10]|uniref:hypothetical protein n=1 Tax=Curtobacterium phyllosphaerae TaxID=3413379 RepID=UPI003BF2A80F